MTTRGVIDLTGPSWRMWRDDQAEWQHDRLHLPPVDVRTLPARPPTAGWDRLARDGQEVSVPATVEQYYWDDIGAYRGVSWWTRPLHVPAPLGDRRVLLQLDAVRLRAEVFLNRRFVAYDLIGETPFEVDITDAVQTGENQLAIRVTDPGGNFSWEDFDVFRWGKYGVPASHGFGGITGGVRALVVDRTFISDVFVQNKPTPSEVNVQATIRNTGDTVVTRDVRIAITATKDPSRVAQEHTLTDCQFPPGETQVNCSLNVAEAQLWAPESPHLYLCHVSLGPDADAVTARFGFRWFAPENVGERAVLRLNDQRIVLRSAISWGFWPVSGSIPTPELARRQIEAAKALGLNMLTFHRCIGTPPVLDLADELGLLYYEEPGGYWSRGGDAFSQAWAREKLLRMVRRDRNHPSLVIYNLINEREAPAHRRHERDISAARTIDPTRTITYTSGWNQFDKPDPSKLHVRPYDEAQHIFGWTDWHHAAGPGCYCDEFYRGPSDYRLHTDNVREIVFWGEEGAIGTPPQLERIVEELGDGPCGWDGADYRSWHAAWADYFERKSLGEHFASIDDLARSCGNIAHYYQGRMIENIRISNCTDGYVVNGWENEKWENHSGIVDTYRNIKGDARILAHYNQPAYVAVKLREKVTHCPADVQADFHLVNEINLQGTFRLVARLDDESGQTHWTHECEVNVIGGETYGQLLVADVTVRAALAGGRYFLRAKLQDGERSVATGVDELFLVDWRSMELPLNGAVVGPAESARHFLKEAAQVDPPALTPHLPRVDYVISQGFNPCPREVIPTEVLTPQEGQLQGLTGAYYRGVNFDELAFKRTDPQLDFDWDTGPDAELGRENYSVCWRGRLYAPESGRYTLYLTHDDGARLWLDGDLLIDEWSVYETWSQARPIMSIAPDIELDANRAYELRIRYFQQPGRGTVRLEWTVPSLQAVAGETTDEILRRVHDDGTWLLALDEGDSWARVLAAAGLVRYRGRLQGGLYWLGSNYFVRPHPLFEGLPTLGGMNWEYQELARYEADRYGLLLDGEEAVVGLVSGHHHAVATAVGVIPHGEGAIVLSTLDLARSLNAPSGPADVTRKLLCNYLTAGVRRA